MNRYNKQKKVGPCGPERGERRRLPSVAARVTAGGAAPVRREAVRSVAARGTAPPAPGARRCAAVAPRVQPGASPRARAGAKPGQEIQIRVPTKPPDGQGKAPGTAPLTFGAEAAAAVAAAGAGAPQPASPKNAKPRPGAVH